MKAIAILSPGSAAGKSTLATALCRLLQRRGERVAPFAAEAESFAPYTTEDGAEIAYPQALQAWAAGLKPRPALNPVLYSPTAGPERAATLTGHPISTAALTENPTAFASQAWEAVTRTLTPLTKDYHWLVCDGFGSLGDRPLRDWDLGNVRLAEHLGAKILLVVDADHGGWLAAVLGTLDLLPESAQKRIAAVVLNRFRGDAASLERGAAYLQEKTGLALVGALPWFEELFPKPTSISLFSRRRRRSDIETSLSVVWLPHLSGFSDFDPLLVEPTVEVRFMHLHEDLGYPDAVILPRSRDWVADLNALHESGAAEQLTQYAAAGGTILGLCEGFQMLGRAIVSFQGLDDESDELAGLDLLPMTTIYTGERVDRQRTVTANAPQAGLPVTGRELRRGYTQILDPKAVDPLFEDAKLGLVSQNRAIWGSYLPGIFDSGPWRRAWLNGLRNQRGLPSLPTGIPDYQEHREILLDNLADWVEAKLDLSLLFD